MTDTKKTTKKGSTKKISSPKKNKRKPTDKSIRKKNPYIIILNIVTMLLFVAATGYLFYILFPLNMIPEMWLYLAVAVMVAVGLLNCIIALLKVPTFIQVLRNVVILGICFGMVFASYTVQSVDQELDEVMSLPTTYSEFISIVALRDSNIYGLEDLEGKKIAYQATIDIEHMNLVKEYLNDNLDKYSAVRYQEYPSAVKDLLNKKIDAIILSESYRPLVEDSYADFSTLTSRIDAYEIERPVTDIKKAIDVTQNSFTVFVSGIDTLGKASLNSQSDVNMIVSVNPLSKSIAMVTIPRDSYLPNACLSYKDDKLTNTGAFGVECTAKTIENAFDVEINYYVKVSFSSIIQAVNALGGLEVNVPYSFCERKANRVDIIYVKKGLQRLNGEQALALARNRKNAAGGDVGRGKNQQMLVNAAIRQFASSDILATTDKLLQVVNDTVQTNLTKQEIYAFINSFASDLGSWTITNHSAGGKLGWGECASIPGMELSIIELADDEITKIKYLLKNTLSDSDLSQFEFTINDVTYQEVQAEGETQGSTGSSFCWIVEEYKNKGNEEVDEEADNEAEGESETQDPSLEETTEITE